MSTHSFSKIDQKEYLKKYLSGNKVKKKKKDKKNKKSASVKVKIIDDDINQLDTGIGIDEELLLAGEDAPQIVGEYIEEAPADRKVPKWKSIVIKDEPENSDADEQNGVNFSGRKSDIVTVKKEFVVRSKRLSKTPDNSPPRRNERKRKSSSPRSRYRRSASPSIKPASKSGINNELFGRAAKIKTEPKSPSFENRDQNIRNKGRDYYDRSPPKRSEKSLRMSKTNSPYQSPAPHSRDSDQSPPRRHRYADQSPTLQKRNNYQSSPERHKEKMNDTENKPTLKSANRSRRYSDESPSRRRKRSESCSQRQRRDSDQSPPRRNKRRHSLSDESPPRKGRNSPYRKRKSEQSPSRRKSSKYKRTPDQSPHRKIKSPIETRKNSTLTRIKRERGTPDLSPHRRHSRWEKQESQKSLSPPPTHKPKPGKTLEGKKAGLQDAQALQKETIERRKQEDLLFEKMSSDVSGRHAEVQVRSTGRKGRRAKEAEREDPEERRRKEEHEEKKKHLYDCWGKGLKQIEDHKNRMLEQEYEGSKPLARYSNDEDLERHLREQERPEDPMLEYMRQKRKEKEKHSDKPQIPRYEGPYPENRFGIRPGYRWDGVDRSNGYEKKYFAVQNEKQARQDEAYKYSVEDM